MNNLPRLALSIRQPWAWAILHAGKDVENRTWWTDFRGPVCIHAAKAMTRREMADFSVFYGDRSPAIPHASALPFGAIVGTVEIVNCVLPRATAGSVWGFGPWCFTLANPRPIEPIPCRGALGFFEWRPHAEAT